MKSEDLKAAVPYLSREEQDLLSDLGAATGKDGVGAALDMDIRHGLSSALGNMGAAVQTLLVLLNRHGMLPPRPCPPITTCLKASPRRLPTGPPGCADPMISISPPCWP